MIAITLARKPLTGTVAQTVLTHGTGGLNIDGCRIGGYLNRTPSGANRFNARLAELGYRPGAYQQAERIPESPPGRWPSNLGLMHRAGCRRTGVTEIPSSNPGNKELDHAQTTVVAYGVYARRSSVGHAINGLETVEVWECGDGCPVMDLNRRGQVSRFFFQTQQEPA